MNEPWLAKAWRKFKKVYVQRQFTSLEFPYRGAMIGRLIAGALAFWELVRDHGQEPEERRTSLKPFLTNNNPLVRLVAMIEQLPDLVWRRIIWRYNIDFVSYESCLRRLTENQIAMIEANWRDLFEEQKLPRAFSWWEKLFRRLTVEKLLAAGYNHYRRYSSKQAWSFNLKPFDIGFNAYPNGPNDDYHEFFVSTKKFLSAKKHADDFVVDREFGLYWLMYRSARSNFVWRSGREVSLKRQICPGFWYTIWMHFWFWIGSPALFIGSFMASVGPSGLHWYHWAGFVFSLLTPAWLVLAACRLVLIGAAWLFHLREETVKKVGIPVIVGVAALAISSGLLYLLFELSSALINRFGLFLGLTLAGATIFSFLAACFVAYFLKERDYDELKDTLFIWIAGLVATGVVFVVKLKIPVFQIIYRFTVRTFWAFWDIVVSVGTLWLMFLPPIGIIVLTWWFTKLSEEKQRRTFLVLERCMPYLTGIFIGLFGVYTFFMLSLRDAIFVVSLMFGTWLFFRRLLLNFNPLRKDVLEIELYRRSCDNRMYEVNYRPYQNNAWLIGLPMGQKYEVIQRASRVVYLIFRHKSKRGKQHSFNWLLERLNENIYARFDELEKAFGLDDYVRVRVLEMICEDHTREYRLVVRRAKEERAALDQQMSELKRAGLFLARPFIAIGHAIACAVGAAVDLAKRLKFLYDEFNKRCPFVAEQKYLS